MVYSLNSRVFVCKVKAVLYSAAQPYKSSTFFYTYELFFCLDSCQGYPSKSGGSAHVQCIKMMEKIYSSTTQHYIQVHTQKGKKKIENLNIQKFEKKLNELNRKKALVSYKNFNKREYSIIYIPSRLLQLMLVDTRKAEETRFNVESIVYWEQQNVFTNICTD